MQKLQDSLIEEKMAGKLETSGNNIGVANWQERRGH